MDLSTPKPYDFTFWRRGGASWQCGLGGDGTVIGTPATGPCRRADGGPRGSRDRTFTQDGVRSEQQ